MSTAWSLSWCTNHAIKHKRASRWSRDERAEEVKRTYGNNGKIMQMRLADGQIHEVPFDWISGVQAADVKISRRKAVFYDGV